VDRREQRADDADAPAGNNVDLDARFVQRAQHARMIRAGRTGAGQDERGAKLRGVTLGRRQRGLDHSASWMVSSLTISNSRVPPGVDTFTESPGSLFRNAR